MTFNTIKNLGFSLLTILLVIAVIAGLYSSRNTMLMLNSVLSNKAPLQEAVYYIGTQLDAATQQFYRHIRHQKVFREDLILAIESLSNSIPEKYQAETHQLNRIVEVFPTDAKADISEFEHQFIDQLLAIDTILNQSDLTTDQKERVAQNIVLIEGAFVRLLVKKESSLDTLFDRLEEINKTLIHLPYWTNDSGGTIKELKNKLEYTRIALKEYQQATRYSERQLLSLTDAEINVLDAWSEMRKSVSEFNTNVRHSINKAQSEILITNKQQIHFLLLLGIAALFSAILISVVIGRILATRLKKLLHGISKISNGDFEYRLNHKGDDDLALLAQHFDQMSEQLKLKNQALYQQANIDPLTSLPNRRKFQKSIKAAIQHALRHHNSVVVLFIDLDNFKRINDSLGHAIGDALLSEVATRLQNNLRHQDLLGLYTREEHSADLYRLGGDEFVVLLQDLNQAHDAAVIARRILHVLTKPLILSGYEVQISASIGISSYPDDAFDADNLVKQADIAMYHAKSHGKNNYHFYSESMNQQVLRQLELENKLRKAIDNESLELYFQPQMNVCSEQVHSMEVLLRWYDEDEGWISPAEFIPVAESCNYIIEIGQWVLQKSCQYLQQWQADNIDIKLAVNISSVQFKGPDFIKKVTQLFSDYRIAPEQFIFELTENILMESSEKNIQLLRQLKSLGVELSVDDFGTGYSSLSYLKRFPLDEVKIDRTFVEDIPQDNNNRTICNAIVAMSQELGLRVVAEGVETAEQMQFLRGCGCDVLQGFLLAKPTSADKLDFTPFRLKDQSIGNRLNDDYSICDAANS